MKATSRAVMHQPMASAQMGYVYSPYDDRLKSINVNIRINCNIASIGTM